jgi:hypothetical protein
MTSVVQVPDAGFILEGSVLDGCVELTATDALSFSRRVRVATDERVINMRVAGIILLLSLSLLLLPERYSGRRSRRAAGWTGGTRLYLHPCSWGRGGGESGGR